MKRYAPLCSLGTLVALFVAVLFFAPVSLVGHGLVAHAQTNNSSDQLSKAVDNASGATGAVLSVCYWIFYKLPAWLLGVSGNFFNALLSIALSSQLFKSNTFVTTGWTVTRDITNLFFIFTLLIMGFKGILGQGGGVEGQIKKQLPTLILVALFINFSAFGVRVLIDISNSAGLLFYNQILVSKQVPTTGSSGTQAAVDDTFSLPPSWGAVKQVDVSGAIVSAFHPQELNNKDFFDALTNTKRETHWFAADTIETKIDNSVLFIFVVFSGAVFLYASYVFFTAGLALLSRLIGLWLAIITAPIAVGSMAFPFLNKTGYGWSKWSGQTLDYITQFPIFMFFLYLIVILSSTTLFGSDVATQLASSSTGIFTKVLLIIIPMAMILGLLQKAQSLAQEMGGELSGRIIGAAKNAVGAVGGVAIGAAGFGLGAIARKTIGAAGAKGASDEELQRRAVEGKGFNKYLARAQLKTYQGLSKASFDPSKTGIVKKGAGYLGINDKQIAKGDIGKKAEDALSLLGLETGLGGKSYEEMKKNKKEGEKKTEEAYINALKDTLTLKGIKADDQDEKAKKSKKESESWKKEYDADAEATEAFHVSQGKAKWTDEDKKKFEQEYKKGTAAVYTSTGSLKLVKDENGNDKEFKGTDKPVVELTAKQLNKKKLSETADEMEFGKGYTTARNAAKERIDGIQPGAFDEKAFQKAWLLGEEYKPKYKTGKKDAHGKDIEDTVKEEVTEKDANGNDVKVTKDVVWKEDIKSDDLNLRKVRFAELREDTAARERIKDLRKQSKEVFDKENIEPGSKEFKKASDRFDTLDGDLKKIGKTLEAANDLLKKVGEGVTDNSEISRKELDAITSLLKDGRRDSNNQPILMKIDGVTNQHLGEYANLSDLQEVVAKLKQEYANAPAGQQQTIARNDFILAQTHLDSLKELANSLKGGKNDQHIFEQKERLEDQKEELGKKIGK